MSRLSAPTERRERRNLFGPKASGSRGYASLVPPNGTDQAATEGEKKTNEADEIRKDLEDDADQEADDGINRHEEEEYYAGLNNDLAGPDGAQETQELDIDQQSEAAEESDAADESEAGDKVLDLRWNTPSEDLTNVMRTQTGEYAVQRVGGIYQALDAQTRSDVDLRYQLVLWYSEQKTDTAAQRALDFFHGLDETERTRPAYAAAIASAMYLNKARQAIQLHRDGSHAKGHGLFGSDLLMPYAISERDWTLAVELLQTVQLDSESDSTRYYRLFSHVLIEGRKFKGHMHDLVQHIGQKSLDESTRSDLQSFLVSLLRHYTVRGICRKKASTDMVPAYQLLRDVFTRAQSIDILPSSAYEYCIGYLARVENAPTPSQHYGLISFLYRKYSKSKAFKPPTQTLHSMLQAWSIRRLSATGSNMPYQGVVSSMKIIQDWQQFYGTIDKSMIFLLMKTYSRLGEVGKVQEYAQQYKTTLGSDLRDASALWPVVYVHAVRRDPRSALQELDSMKQSFGVEPSIQCFNIVIYAFERTDDIEGAKGTMQRLLKTGLKPDEYSFGPIVSICGKFGDIEGVREMLDLATQYNVTPSTLMLNSLMVAYTTSGDVASAEQSLNQAAESVRSGRAHGSMTLCYNTLMTAYAYRRDTRGTMRVYGLAKSEGVTLDANSYSALMLALCLVRKTNEAYKIVKTVMRAENIRPTAAHYAVVMLGYIQQGMPQEALRAHHDMLGNLIPESSSTRAAYLKAKSRIEAKELRFGGPQELGLPIGSEGFADSGQFVDSQQVYTPINSQESADSQQFVEPQQVYAPTDTQQSVDPPQFDGSVNVPLTDTINELLEAMPADELGYQKGILPGIPGTSPQGISSFEYLIQLHGARQCFDAVTHLFEQWRQSAQPVNIPVRMLTALMFVQLQAGQFSEVERYWGLVQAEVVRLQKKQRPQEPEDTDDDARTRISPPTTEISSDLPQDPLPVFRRLLSRPLQLYLRALSHKENPPVALMTQAFTSLLSSAYTLDNLTWNTYITILCQVSPPRTLLAFTLVERFLINEFPGWSRPRANLRGDSQGIYYMNKGARSQGMEYTKARYLGPDQLMPQYRTFVHLAGALLELRSMENLGRVPRRGTTQEERDVKAQVGSIREIRKRAPKTLAAVTNMPTVYDELQERLIRHDVDHPW
ncbi:hypothetical protein MBLNU457_g0491t1 [Dothideomycetes sp. NU457]